MNSELNYNVFSTRDIYSRGIAEILLPDTPLTINNSNFNHKT